MAHLECTEEGGVLVVRFIHEELCEVGLVRDIGEEFMAVTQAASGKKLLLDFTGVATMSSIMIGQLFVLRSRCRAESIDLRMCGLSPQLVKLLDLVHLTNFLQSYDDQRQAVAAFNQADANDGPADVTLAADDCRTAAEQGDASAQFNLARCCEEGRGARQDMAEALKWYRQAADQGHAEAQYALGKSFAYGIHVAQDYDQAVAWYRKAAEQGHAEAQYALGMTHNYGLAGEANVDQAAHWYRQAAAQGHPAAKEALAETASRHED